MRYVGYFAIPLGCLMIAASVYSVAFPHPSEFVQRIFGVGFVLSAIIFALTARREITAGRSKPYLAIVAGFLALGFAMIGVNLVTLQHPMLKSAWFILGLNGVVLLQLNLKKYRTL